MITITTNKIETNLIGFTKFFVNLLFIKPLSIVTEENDIVAKIEFDDKTGELELYISAPSTFITRHCKVKGKDKRAAMASLLNFINRGQAAFCDSDVEVIETIIMQNLDAITSCQLEIIPTFTRETFESLEDFVEITAYGKGTLSQYVVDGIQCTRGILTKQILELGEPLGLQIPYAYVAIIAGGKIAFNQTLDLDHNVLTRGEDGKLLEPISTGSVSFHTNGFVNVIKRHHESIDVDIDGEQFTYDLVGQKPKF